jgi:hypothetical protein
VAWADTTTAAKKLFASYAWPLGASDHGFPNRRGSGQLGELLANSVVGGILGEYAFEVFARHRLLALGEVVLSSFVER